VKIDLKNRLKIFWKGWGYTLFIAILLATSFKSAIADWYVVPTGSMRPTIVDGDRIFVNKLAYDLKVPYTLWHIAEWGNPHRGDIVVFYSPADGERLVKRVVGVPGDTVAMRNNQLIINGRPVDYEPIGHIMSKNANAYDYIEELGDSRHPVMITPWRPALRSFGPLVVPKGKYFMMGDNRDNSADSRYFGCVDRHRIVGRAISVVISLDIHDKYQPRWGRFFTRLP
jgi:signal peptidase I